MAGMKRKREGEYWSDVASDVLESIMRRLCFVDILRMKRACSWWYSVAESYASSPSYLPCFQTPWLLLPNDDDDDDDKGKISLCFFNLYETKAYRDVCLCKEVYEGRCVGSSHGWLFLLDKTANLSLYNPFSGARFQVEASLKKGDHASEEEYLFDVDAKKYKGGRAFISKAILMMSDRDKKKINKDKDGVVLIYQGRKKLTFCMFKDGRFIDLDGAHRSYTDVICYHNLVCAISELHGDVEVWDFSTAGSSYPSPTKVMDIRSSLPFKKAIDFQKSMEVGCCSLHFYLVESCAGELLSVVRIIGEYMKNMHVEYGKGNQPKKKNIRNQYKTLMFYVFKLDLRDQEFVEMESLGDQVLFLGGNYSISLRAEDCPGCLKDSIYFTDSHWEYADEDDSYGGHDIGYYSFKDRCVKPLFDTWQKRGKMKPIPFWVLPNPW